MGGSKLIMIKCFPYWIREEEDDGIKLSGNKFSRNLRIIQQKIREGEIFFM